MRRVGIDPGVTGALALLDDDLQAVQVIDMPTLINGKKNEVNAVALGKILYKWSYDIGTNNLTIILEEVHAMPKQGVTSTFGFGDSFGCVRGVCGALQISMIRIPANQWKKKAGLLRKPKDAARALAQHLYPEVDLALKKHIGRADALLIARYGGL